MSQKHDIIQYVPFMSFVHPSFWHTLSETKLDVDRLNENTKQIFGRYNYRDDIGAALEVDGTSFNSSPQSTQFYINVKGTIMNKNTVEDFKNIDKIMLINSIGEIVWSNIVSKNWISNPNSLLNFFILSFADLKKFHYYYWFAFPSPSQPTVYLNEKKEIANYFNSEDINKIQTGHGALNEEQRPFFVVTKGKEINVLTLNELFDRNEETQTLNFDLSVTYFGFIDPSNTANPGWPLRLYLAALFQHCPSLKGKTVQALGLRFQINGDISKSMILSIEFPDDVKSSESSGWLGWERNDKGNFGPMLANMSYSMDPVKLADTSADLNIRLMKWRLVPDLNFTILKETKCLLLGAGTLGCHVARNLLAWGIRHITLVDYGKVSYSNPVRQSLLTHGDARAGRAKAEAAADNLRLILPSVEAKGLLLHIPMPGHPVGEALKAETLSNIDKLEQEIKDHDVIFLLLDTREARWLPTLLGAYYKKIVINAALGFDSYLVMRHGIGSDSKTEDPVISNAEIKGSQLGCYFCNDVTAPGNSLRSRSLDQQCTVSRPGASAAAAAFAVELLAGLLQHPLRIEAPAYSDMSEEAEKDVKEQGVLGAVPHSIRGFLHSYQNVVTRCVKFKQCIACSQIVLNKYKEEGKDFILKVCDSRNYLEEVTGLTELQLTAEMTDVLAFSDEDEN